MKAKVIKHTGEITQLVTVECPVCMNDITFHYLDDNGLKKKRKSEVCINKDCNAVLNFGYGDR